MSLIKDILYYPSSNIEDLIDSLYGNKYFTVLDLKRFIKMEVSVKYMVFTMPFG